MKRLIFLLWFPFYLSGQQIDVEIDENYNNPFQFFLERAVSYFYQQEYDLARLNIKEAGERFAETLEEENLALVWNTRIDSAVLVQVNKEKEIIKIDGIKSESNRLALIANNEIAEESYKDAYNSALQAKLSFDRLKYDTFSYSTPDTFSYEIERTFGQAVQHHFMELVYSPESDEQIRSFELIPNTKNILVVTDNNKIILVDEVGKDTTLLTSRHQILDYTFSPSGSYLFVYFLNGRALLINLKQLNPVLNFVPHDERTVFALFSPDERHILTCSRDDKARLWSIQGDTVATLKGHLKNVYGGDFSPIEDRLLTRSYDGTVRLWDFNGNLIGGIIRHANYIHTAIFSADGNAIITGSADSTVKVWDKEGVHPINLGKFNDVVNRANNLPQTNYTLISSLGNHLKLFDIVNKEEFPLSRSSPNSTYFFEPKQKKLFLGEDNGGLIEYHLSNGIHLERELNVHSQRVIAIDFHPKKQLILSTSEDSTAKLWMSDGKIWIDIDLESKSVIPARFSTDGRGVYSIISNTLRYFMLPDEVYKERHVMTFSKD